MELEKIYVFHKSGANNHYQALAYLLEQSNKQIVYREFSIFCKIYKSIIKLNLSLFLKQITNICFLVILLFSRNKKIIVGIAPIDSKLRYLLPLLKNHRIFYHTSWANWSGGFYPKSKKIDKKSKEHWRCFLEEIVEVVFAVTETTKQELLSNYKIRSENISVVNHSFDNNHFVFDNKLHPNKFICVGRLRPDKGIQEILDFFSKNPSCQITFVGSGVLASLIMKYEKKFPNIKFEGFVSDKSKLNGLYNQHDYLILNSQRTSKWEELFGMVLIEGMACGLIPIATNHAGPKEILKKDVGCLFAEGKLSSVLANLSAVKLEDKQKATKASQKYALVEIAKKWNFILKN